MNIFELEPNIEVKRVIINEPLLLVSKVKGTIILVNTLDIKEDSYGKQEIAGTVVKPGNDSLAYIGYHRTDWKVKHFNIYKGKITFDGSND